MKVRDFLRVARAHQPEESLRAFMDPLADAVSCATKWLKSSVERLYEKVSSAGKAPRHEANHRSVHERFAART